MKELTRAEEQIMHVLWALEKAFVKDIIERLPDPKPAYNTVSTIVRILEKKGFVDHEAFGKTHLYRPIVAKEDYTQAFLKHFIKDYFDDSYQELVSFFAKDKDLTVAELEEILAALREEIKRQKAEKNG
ncbi:MAG TPA: BlaI/MecI/CopY family transcriptional regulator [Candidatus Aminicenantes bacterium]|nr:BlaI/MecI/CopY family transcriptional regulator [Candidatus Aminicenantes bacterium]HDT13789.1 BlaI/MecI/CopY family transcriptional regulator [Candidatus Aminicenantes bacterium]